MPTNLIFEDWKADEQEPIKWKLMITRTLTDNECKQIKNIIVQCYKDIYKSKNYTFLYDNITKRVTSWLKQHKLYMESDIEVLIDLYDIENNLLEDGVIKYE